MTALGSGFGSIFGCQNDPIRARKTVHFEQELGPKRDLKVEKTGVNLEPRTALCGHPNEESSSALGL
jgi:hypothetical protein